MPSEAPQHLIDPVSDSPLIFPCPHCHTSISAPREMLGESAQCPHCEFEFEVVVEAGPARSPGELQAELQPLQDQLKENMTQTTELRGNMSRLNMELHRHQLRLDKLLERQNELNAQIGRIKSQL